ncbi:hypothetical protein HYU92_03865 [Candidatus Curtissbacteria bacterium]|nr:hypothetical protein [Candidatus Curtissbacteria bacterium]
MKIVNQQGFSSILIISVFVVLLVSIPLGAFYLKGQVQNKSQEATNSEKLLKESKGTNKTPESKPENIITAFFQAVKDKNKSKAKSYLSENVNKAAFKSTFENDTNSPSLYNQEFSYKITETKTDFGGNKAFVNVDLVVSGQTLPTVVTLEKNTSGIWLISNSETAVYGNTNLPFEEQQRQPESLKRVFLVLTGPADFYLTSPEGTHAGYDPKTGERLNGIEDVYYEGRLPDQLESFAITDMIGSWELKVIGNGEGEYSLMTRLVNTLKEDSIKKSTSKGKIDTYILQYPTGADKPLEVTPVN